jgi:hypothetical protein
MNTNGRVRPKDPNVATSFSGLAHDVIEMGELQAKLFALDVKCTAQRTRTSLLLSVIGICLLLGSVPVALFAVAEVFHEQLGWSQAAGFAAAALIGIAISAGLLATALSRFNSGMVSIERSRDELNRNIAWIKSSLRNQQPAVGCEPESSRAAGAPPNPR